MNVTIPVYTYGSYQIAKCDDCGKIIDSADRQDCISFLESEKCADCLIAEQAQYAL